MPAYTNISNGLVSVGAKPFATTMQALRDNPLAIAEGDALAPRIQDAALDTGAATTAGTTWVGLRIAAMNAGDVGSYAMLKQNTASAQGPGYTTAGSGLLYANAGDITPSTSPSGTWRLMGRLGGTGAGQISLWLRIS